MKHILTQEREKLRKEYANCKTKQERYKYSKALIQIEDAIKNHLDNYTDNWSNVQDKITSSKIQRFNYNKLLGESLTSYITKRKDKSNLEIEKEIMNTQNVKELILTNHFIKSKFLENVRNSINSRRAEQQTHLRRL